MNVIQLIDDAREQIAAMEPTPEQIALVSDPDGTPVPENPALLRAWGRALGEIDRWEAAGIQYVRSATAMVIRSTETGERRLVFSYPIEAVAGQPYLVKPTPDGDATWFMTERIDDRYADGQLHTVWCVWVERVDEDGNLRPPMVSKGVRRENLGKFAIAQGDSNILDGDPLYVNPLAHTPKDAVLARLLHGETFAIGEAGLDVVREFYRDQWRIRFGLSYQS